MKESSTDSPSYLDRIRSWARTKAHGPSPLSPEKTRNPILPISSTQSSTQHGSIATVASNATTDVPSFPSDLDAASRQSSSPTVNNVADNTSSDHPPPAPPPQAEGEGAVLTPAKAEKKHVAIRFYITARSILFSSWINVLLVFVPVGIAVKAAHASAILIFVMNAVAIIPLAGLLSHATESVAKRMGDTVGALMNVTFGNAVELIIFMYVTSWGSRQERARSPLKGIIISIASHIILTLSPLFKYAFSNIALAEDEISIVQASLLGSILANLLLILGMCFLVGGLRFREQIYNSTVTQMSACLLSLSVMSLLLPTAFHASFSNAAAQDADDAVLKVSRGTSIILLLVYGLYLLFQLKSHAYMYESTPQHIIDEESQPGPIAIYFDSSSSSDESSSGSDSDSSRGSNTTAARIRRVMRGGRKHHRKASVSSKETAEIPRPARTSSYATGNGSVIEDVGDSSPVTPTSITAHRFGAFDFADADDDVNHAHGNVRGSGNGSRSHSFTEKHEHVSKKERRKHKKRHGKDKKHHVEPIAEKISEQPALPEKPDENPNEPRRVDFAVTDLDSQMAQKRAFMLGGINLRPTIGKTFSQTVFSQPSRTGSPQFPGTTAVNGPIPRVRYGIRRTNSLPDRLNQGFLARIPSQAPPPATPAVRSTSEAAPEEEDGENISRTTAVLLLLISTGLVALCAEFMVSSIQDVTDSTSLGTTFVGLIILPIVGNAAEHVTAVTVASKNKMDLAIGVAVGSSIQIALFVTPFIVLLGWMMDKDMTLYFTLFETVSLFVSAFIVNFLVLDGRSNYLEGALLCAAYVIIAVASFFYPGTRDQSNLGGNQEASRLVRSILGM